VSRPEARSARKLEARSTGVRGETCAYWYLRRHGYVFVARNYMPRGIKGELDLIGYDGKTLAFVEVRTRTVKEDAAALPELSLTRGSSALWFARRNAFSPNATSKSAPYASTLWPLIIIPASLPSGVYTKTPLALISEDGVEKRDMAARSAARDVFTAASAADGISCQFRMWL
jgi:Holliday junction resolvase-like predicted endonuclease